jgi:hypothetical protein
MKTPPEEDDFVRTLLDSAKQDAPRAAALSRELDRLGLGATLAAGIAATRVGESAAGLSTGAKTAGVTTVAIKGALLTSGAKISIALVFATATLGATLFLGDATRTSPPGKATNTPTPKAPLVIPTETPPSVPAELAESTSAPPVAVTETVKSASPVMPSRSFPRPAQAKHSISPGAALAEASLSEEVLMIDRARQLVREHPRESLTALGEHQRRFPQGALRDEATLLRVEALVNLGDLESARRLAEPLIASRSDAPIATRMRALLERR